MGDDAEQLAEFLKRTAALLQQELGFLPIEFAMRAEIGGGTEVVMKDMVTGRVDVLRIPASTVHAAQAGDHQAMRAIAEGFWESGSCAREAMARFRRDSQIEHRPMAMRTEFVGGVRKRRRDDAVHAPGENGLPTEGRRVEGLQDGAE